MKITLLPRHEVTRRDALKLLGGGIATLAAACQTRAGDEQIVPYVEVPPELRPGVPVRYTSMLVLDGFAQGVIVETHDGRPTKIDGNPAHPANLGGSMPWMQARILDLYDPQRSQTPRIDGQIASWQAIRKRLNGPLWFVMPPYSSPTIARLLEALAMRREIHVVTDAPVDHRVAYRGTQLVLGKPLEVQPDFARADVVLSLDADFLTAMPAWARAFAKRRTPDARMNRLWLAEPTETATGTLADERLAIPAGDIACLATCIASEVGVPVPEAILRAANARVGANLLWVRDVAADLLAHRGTGLTLVGDRQPAAVHALARLIDDACGNPTTITAPALQLGGETLAQLVTALGRGATPIVIDCNPVYTAPRSLKLAEALRAAPFSLQVGPYHDQTADACHAHVPLAHPFETWSDARAWDGTLTIGQPLVRPRFDVVSTIDLLASLLDDPRDARAIVREGHADWEATLRRGFVEGKAPAVPAHPVWTSALTQALEAAVAPTEGVEIALTLSPQIHDGRFAANAWLQELPHPITKQTWGNAALVDPATALRLELEDGDRVEVTTASGTIVLPAIVVPGGASTTIELGYGQLAPHLPIADRAGADAYALRTDDGLILHGKLRKLSGTLRLSRTQMTFRTHGREIVPATTLAAYRAEPNFVVELRGPEASLLPPQNQDGLQWGMSIDTSICTGCSACMVACQAENNIATVGASNVERGRHMNWLRIDRYVRDDGLVVNEPMPCQHCENAPCEYVCPVMATTHSHDGLNEQTYNRCVGTRFCSNNCPYKVRRFNWFAFETPQTTRSLQYNPDVTVRSRGVMEKCTYCVQRIRGAEHRARVEHRAIAVGEIQTACQQACPTNAIVFGALSERGTQFAAMRHDPRRFDVLHDLGTRPRTQYLAKITNPRGRR
jgi:molybdopterin-containing oxidoreductase family iron-sulfur binding subunit